ncbi:MAG: hypothetical protein OXF22_05255 [Anaerolineaceae bacterium]|nr:hypothetical protein [Anaerolineaceae bacterium]
MPNLRALLTRRWPVLILAAAVLLLGYVYFRERSEAPTTTPIPTSSRRVLPTLQPPPAVDRPLYYSEDTLESGVLVYGPDLYPAYAEQLPESPCATWENGGLNWIYFDRTAPDEQGWFVELKQPDFRFCGFPTPYPAKPTEATATP